MYAQTALALISGLAAVASAAPAPAPGSLVAERQETAQPPLTTWHATSFSEGCSPGGCISSFHVTAPAGSGREGEPAFDVVCHPVYIQNGWATCDADGSEAPEGSVVQALWTEASRRELVRIAVAHQWVDGEARYNASGAAEFDPAGGVTTFDVPVTVITGVA